VREARRAPAARRIAGWAGAAAALGLWPADVLAQACSMCRTAIQSPDDPLARGINLSVMLMVTAPFAVVGSIGGWLAYTYRRARTAAGRGPEPGTAGGAWTARSGVSADGPGMNETLERQTEDPT